MLRLFCRLVGHRRDINRVRPSPAGWRSHCLFCHQPMIRLAHRQWCLERDRPPVVLRSGVPPARRRQDQLDPTERAEWVVRDLFDPGDAAR